MKAESSSTLRIAMLHMSKTLPVMQFDLITDFLMNDRTKMKFGGLVGRRSTDMQMTRCVSSLHARVSCPVITSLIVLPNMHYLQRSDIKERHGNYREIFSYGNPTCLPL